MISIDRAICNDFQKAEKREWLETNGLGGFASSTVAGINTRRYHGLLMAATQPPTGRMLLLSKLEETLVLGDRRFDLSANCYPGAIHPRGFELLAEFRLDPFPTFVYRVDNVEIEKRVFMVHGENTTVVEFELRSVDGELIPSSVLLEIRPLVAFRDYHSTAHRNDSADPAVDILQGLASVRPYDGVPRLYFGHNADRVEPTGNWYFNFELDVERERGLDCHEDLLNPFVARYDLHTAQTAVLIASTQPRLAADASRLRPTEVVRRRLVVKPAESQGPLIEGLYRAADQFIVKRGAFESIIAGYHWFADWGRDTMIALPGLTLATGRFEIARNILEAFSAHIEQGMLPNRFPDAGETPEYNTVDATLWFFEAVRSYLKYTSDYNFVREVVYPKLTDIVEWHLRGTRYGIRVDSDGLLQCGEPGVQLTWMDAKVGDWVVTPRHGKPVEIQALWYNALRVTEDLAERFGSGSESIFGKLADRASASFARQFWNSSAGCPYDVVNGDDRDASIRPNQILAVSLFHKMLNPDQAAQVIETARRHLLTPFGLRTLSPSDPRYRGRYEGGPRERDGAYHQGTVWPWLMGPFLKAYIEVNGRAEASRKQAAQWLSELSCYIENEGVGQLPEVFDGDFPHRAGGCIAQAWTIAELLRTCVEDVYQAAPPQIENLSRSPLAVTAS
jgi:predicted glycogen debranching enzyme